MSAIEHNLEHEEKLLDIFGYTLEGPDGSNRWIIRDENQEQIGFIQYKKFHNGNPSKGTSKIFGYKMSIDSPTIKCEFQRSLNDYNGNIIEGDDIYQIRIKREDKKMDDCYIKFGKTPSISLFSRKYGYTLCEIVDDGLYLDFESETEKFNLKELLVYKNTNDENKKKIYVYELTFCDKDHKISSDNPKGKTTKSIYGTRLPEDEKKLRIDQSTEVDGKFTDETTTYAEETIKEMAVKHEMGINCFNRFRFLINQIIPTKKDIVSTLMSDEIVEKHNLSILLPDYEKKSSVQKRIGQNNG